RSMDARGKALSLLLERHRMPARRKQSGGQPESPSAALSRSASDPLSETEIHRRVARLRLASRAGQAPKSFADHMRSRQSGYRDYREPRSRRSSPQGRLVPGTGQVRLRESYADGGEIASVATQFAGTGGFHEPLIDVLGEEFRCGVGILKLRQDIQIVVIEWREDAL